MRHPGTPYDRPVGNATRKVWSELVTYLMMNVFTLFSLIVTVIPFPEWDREEHVIMAFICAPFSMLVRLNSSLSHY
jgi:hypothetical protein